MMTTYYPQAYHVAMGAIIEGDVTRTQLARALRALRRKLGHKRARRCRRHMLFVCGMFPDKG